MQARIIRSGLMRKGFQKREGSNHEIYSIEIDGKIAATTVMSRSSSRDVSKNIISKMSKQLHMRTTEEFLNYIQCTYSYEDYTNYLKMNYLD
ncbi:MAG: hypothetical protein GYA60_09420 [Candidatus Methanofastidiosa archaeon]|nr:hypothetical protein [Candidatus Methanofastidiosa archaeon]